MGFFSKQERELLAALCRAFPGWWATDETAGV